MKISGALYSLDFPSCCFSLDLDNLPFIAILRLITPSCFSLNAHAKYTGTINLETVFYLFHDDIHSIPANELS